MGNYSALNSAISGLLAQQRVMDAIANNIANSQTEGYTRRRVELQSAGVTVQGVWSKSDQVGSGVRFAGVTRMAEQVLTEAVRRELGSQGNATKTSEIYTNLEQLVPEPSDSGISAQLAKFWSAWDDAAASPGDTSARAALLESGESLVSTFNSTANNIMSLRENMRSELRASILQVNSDAQKVATLNASIVSAKAAGADTSDLQDQRDLIVERIMKATGANASEDDEGSLNIFIGGTPLVHSSTAETLQLASIGTLAAPLDANGFQEFEVQWTLADQPVSQLSGTTGALITGLNDIVPQALYELDQVVSSVVSGVNALHSTGHGLDVTNDVNLKFFDSAGTTAATMTISSDVRNQPSRVALASASAGQLDGSLATQIAQLAESTTGPDTSFRTMIANLANQVSMANTRAETQTKVTDQAKATRESSAGVNLDEELTNLVQAQHAYQAASRVVNAVSEMLDTLVRLGT